MLTLVSALRRNLAQFRDRAAVLEPDRTWTWAEFADRVARAATVLGSLGVRPGDTFGVLSRNSARYFELLHAGCWSGAIAVPLNHRLAAPELVAILEHARCRRVFVEAGFLHAFDTPPLAHWRDRLVCISDIHSQSPPGLEALLATARPAVPADPRESDLAMLLYTGGTTGRAKGVPLSHRNIVANALQVSTCVHFAADDVYLHVAPMFHSADLLGTGVTLQGGAHAFLSQFDPDGFVGAVARFGATRTMLAPAMVGALLAGEAGLGGELASMRQIFYGSSPMPAATIRQTLQRFAGVSLAQGYGLTETSPLLTLLSMASHEEALRPGGPIERLSSAGRALPCVDLRIADDAGRALEAGEVGEVWTRGPNVTAGYLDSPEDTAHAFRDGWFRTGDVGRLDADGFLTLLDRRKDMIITGGENVYSVEVEAVLVRHPAIREAAVIGVPDERFGEALLAVVVCRAGSTLGLDEMIDHCRQHIGGYKTPRRLRVVDELPRSALGKVLKSELRRREAAAATAAPR